MHSSFLASAKQSVQRWRWRVSEKSESPKIGRDPYKLPELSSFQDQARIQQRGRSKSKKTTWAEFISRSGQFSTTWPYEVATWAEFISRSGQGSATWPYVSNVSSFQDQARVQQREFISRSGRNVAVREQREFISRSGQGSTMWPYEV